MVSTEKIETAQHSPCFLHLPSAIDTETYKLLSVFTEDGYKIEDVFSHQYDTGAITKSELAEFLIRTWQDETFGYPGILQWFQAHPAIGALISNQHGHPDGLSPSQREAVCAAIRTQIATEGPDGLISAVQLHPNNPVFFLKRNEPNPAFVDFMLALRDAY